MLRILDRHELGEIGGTRSSCVSSADLGFRDLQEMLRLQGHTTIGNKLRGNDPGVAQFGGTVDTVVCGGDRANLGCRIFSTAICRFFDRTGIPSFFLNPTKGPLLVQFRRRLATKRSPAIRFALTFPSFSKSFLSKVRGYFVMRKS